MKLLKYFFFLIILIASIYFLIELNLLNTENGEAIKIKIPFMSQDISSSEGGSLDTSEISSQTATEGYNVWLVLLITFTIGVVIGFIISLIQMISLKGETISLKSKNKKIQIELDALRNQGLEDELELEELEDNNISL